MSISESGPKDSVTEVAEESFVRERPPDIERGTVLAGRYQIEDIIGKGGSGIVLRVFDRTAQNVVALKVLKTELARDTKWDRRFSRELRLGRPIQHPNVCRIFDIGEADGHRFLTMELAKGGSLRDEMKRRPSEGRPIEDRLADARAAISGLDAIHVAGVVHRDFKPDNLLRMEDGRLVLSDFGLATDAANAPGVTVLIGTPHYMAPEVLAGEPATSRSDVWGLGVVLHEIFFGRRPERRPVGFDGSNKEPAYYTSATERQMLALCQCCLAEAPLDCPADAGVVAELFESRSEGGARRQRRRVGALAYGAGAMLLIFGVRGVLQYARHGGELSGSSDIGLIQVDHTATPVDMTGTAKVVTEINGHIDCWSMLNSKTARLIWGTPRRADDLDLSTGRLRPADLAVNAYRTGCPEVSPSGQSLVFTAQNRSGVNEINVSTDRTGHSATAVASGSDPLWIGDRNEFVYDIDPSHVAVFSLPTTTMVLLPEPSFGKRRTIIDKAVSEEGDVIAVLECDESGRFAVIVYSGHDYETVKPLLIPWKSRIQFANSGDALYMSYRPSASASFFAELDWRRARAREIGRYPGFDVEWARVVNGRPAVVVARRMTSDIWFNDIGRHERLTRDGNNFSAARFPSGELLLGKRNDSGRLNIWRQRLNGEMIQATFGDFDVVPEISPDGVQWAYADYTNRRIVLCQTMDGKCRPLCRDEMPSWPVFSPDGANLAYITQVGVQRMTVVSTKDGERRSSWDAYSKCPAVWSSNTTVWSLEALQGQYAWFERKIGDGAKTGNRLEVPTEDVTLGEIPCSPRSVGPGSPFFQHIRVETEERSRILTF